MFIREKWPDVNSLSAKVKLCPGKKDKCSGYLIIIHKTSCRLIYGSLKVMTFVIMTAANIS